MQLYIAVYWGGVGRQRLSPFDCFLYYTLTLSFIIATAAAAAAKSLQLRPTLCDPIDAAHQAPRLWDSPGKNTGVGCHFLLQCMKVKSESEFA